MTRATAETWAACDQFGPERLVLTSFTHIFRVGINCAPDNRSRTVCQVREPPVVRISLDAPPYWAELPYGATELQWKAPVAETFAGTSYMDMESRSCAILVALLLAGAWMAVAQTNAPTSGSKQTLFAKVNSNASTKPAIAVSTRLLDFGAVPVGSSSTLSFTVRNVGPRTLTGGADVSAPFSIVGGTRYALKGPQTQVITVQYAPKSIGMHMTVIRLTGADGARVTLMGSAVPPSPTAPARQRAPNQTPGLRLIAGD